MISKDYRALKAKNVTEIKTDGTMPVFERPLYNTITGSVSQIRSDSVYTADLEARRAELVEEIKDIDAMLADISTALSLKATEIGETKELP